MKKQLQLPVLLTAFFCALFFNCSPEDNDSDCGCEEAIYIEEKFQEASDNSWQLNRVEISRTDIECQDETDFIRTGNGTEVRRIECN